MKPEDAQRLLPYVQAFAEGNDVRRRNTLYGEWQHLSNEGYFYARGEYRIFPPKPRTGTTFGISPGSFDAIELTDEVKQALDAAGIEY